MHIVSAAILYQDKRTPHTYNIVKGKSHSDCIQQFKQMGLLRADRNLDTEVQGFVTDNGTFVDREQAYIIAKLANQLKEENANGILYSEFTNY